MDLLPNSWEEYCQSQHFICSWIKEHLIGYNEILKFMVMSNDYVLMNI